MPAHLLVSPAKKNRAQYKKSNSYAIEDNVLLHTQGMLEQILHFKDKHIFQRLHHFSRLI
jgi:hypothetical protein